jgi:hypothetical protein
MVQQQRNQAAQYIYLAQLDAQNGKCTCKACQLLRKCNDVMVNEALSAPQPAAGETLEIPLGASGDNPV